MPSVVTTGRIAFRKAYTTTMRYDDSPLARAVRTKSLDSAESIDARVIRASGAREKMPSENAGSRICASAARSVPNSPDSTLSTIKSPVNDGGAEPGRARGFSSIRSYRDFRQQVPIGDYELRFKVADYFASKNVPLSDPPFLDSIPLRFSVSEPEGHLHVPLLVTPWSYATYRGS